MSERLAELQRAISDSRRRLEALARRAAELRARLGRPEADPTEGEPFLFEDTGAAPGVMNDLDLNFEALDVDGSDREET